MIEVLIDPGRVPSLDSVADMVRAGLPGESERFTDAWINDQFYQGKRPDRDYLRREAEDDAAYRGRPKRKSLITRTVIRKLAEPLYNPGPTRTLDGAPRVDTWLQQVHADVHINARMQSADRHGTLNHVSALQVEATGDPARPVRLWLWKAHEFACFFPPDDGLTPWAVCTREVVPEPDHRHFRGRYRLWSAAERQTFVTEPVDDPRAAFTHRAETLLTDESGPSPYRGVLPFAFVRNESPESAFWEGGIGTPLRECNVEIDRGLSDIAEHLQWFLNPLTFVRNVPASWRMTVRTGSPIVLPSMPAAREGDMRAEPDIFHRQATLGVDAAWYDLKTYADSCLEELEVPLTVVRSDASTDLSGVAIVAKTIPLLNRTRARQPQFAEHETELAATVLAVAGTWYGLKELLVACRDPKLTVVFPEPAFPLPTAERDAEDRAALDMGIASKTTVVMRRDGLTRPQAQARLAEIADDLELEAKLFAAEPTAAPETPGEPEPDMGEPTAAPESAGAVPASAQANGKVPIA